MPTTLPSDTKTDLTNLRSAIEEGVGLPINAIRSYTPYEDGSLDCVFRIDKDLWKGSIVGNKFTAEPLDDGRSDSLHLDKDCGKGSIADNLRCHAGESAGQVAAWGAGKVVGGAIAHVASAHGIDPAAAKVISESAVQALTATAIHARNGNTAAGELAKKFITEAASAFIGKNMAGFDDAILGGDDDTRSFLESVSSQPLSKLVGTTLKGQAQTLKGLLTRTGAIHTDAADSLSDAEQEALFDLALVGYVLEKDDREARGDDRTDALPTFTKRLNIQGVKIGVTHEPGDRRFLGSMPMQSYYGLVLGTYGMADDGKSIDMYLGHDSSNEDLWKISQTTPDGEFDEYKYGTNYSSGKAFRDAHIYHAGVERSGVLSPASWDELKRDKGDEGEDDRTDEEDWHEDAAAKKCTPSKSHFCRRPGGSGTCLPLTKQCRYTPTGELKKKADRIAELVNKPSSGLPHDNPQTHEEFIANGRAIVGEALLNQAKDATARLTQIEDEEFSVRNRLRYDVETKKHVWQKLPEYRALDEEIERVESKMFALPPNRGEVTAEERAVMAELDALYKKRYSYAAQVEAIEDEFIDKHPEIEKLRNELQQTIAPFEQFKSSLLQSSALNESEAKKLAGKAKVKGRDPSMRGNLAEFFRLTNGQGSESLKNIQYSNKRSHANPFGIIEIVPGDKRCLFHEVGHHVEFESPTNLAAAKGWLLARASSPKAKSLNSLTKTKDYESDEKAYPDAFIHPYVGKVYARSTEVISMGVESFATPARMALLAGKDPEHFALVVGMIRNPSVTKGKS